jgi:hypothetical protein
MVLCVKRVTKEQCPVCCKERVVAEIIESVEKIELTQPRVDVIMFHGRKTCRPCFVKRMAEYFGQQFDEAVQSLKRDAEKDE